MLQNYTQWHTERAPTPSTRKVNSVEEVDSLTAKVDHILALMSKSNVENVPIQDLVGNNAESVDVNYIRNFGNNGYGNNYSNNAHARPPYAPNNYGSRPFIPYPNANDKWKNESNLPTNSNVEKPQDKSLAEQVANHASLIKELQGSITSMGNDIGGCNNKQLG